MATPFSVLSSKLWDRVHVLGGCPAAPSSAAGSERAGAAVAAPATLAGAADDLFDAWYDIAKEFAQGRLRASDMSASTLTAVRALASVHIAGSAAMEDLRDAILSNLLGCLSRITSIYASKPKFATLLQTCVHAGEMQAPFAADDAPAAHATLSDLSAAVMPFLVALFLRSTFRGDSARRCDAAANVARMLALEAALPRGCGCTCARPPSSFVPLDRVAGMVTDVASDMLLRDAASNVLTAACSVPSTADSASTRAMLLVLIARSNDAIPLQLLWRLRVSSDAVAMTALKARATVERRATSAQDAVAPSVGFSTSAAGSAHVDRKASRDMGQPVYVQRTTADGDATLGQMERTTTLYAGMSAWERDVLSTLQEALMNERSARADSPRGGSRSDSLSIPAVLTLLQALDVFQPVSGVLATAEGLASCPLSDSGEALERPDEWLAVARALIELAPDETAAYRTLCAYPSIASLAELAALITLPHEHAWLTAIAPFLSTALAHMKLNVTGSQEDQEVVNVLRDGVRAWYVHSDRSRVPSAQLGHTFFTLMLAAIAHGYGDTDRFPELAARVLRAHHEDGSPSWLQDAFSDSVCVLPSAQRAVNDVVLMVLGQESGSATYGIEESARGGDVSTSEALVSDVLTTLADVRSRSCDSFWRELADTRPALVRAHPAAVSRLCASVATQLDDTYRVHGGVGIAPREVSLMLTAMAACATPATAPAIFSNLSRTLSLLDRAHNSVMQARAAHTVSSADTEATNEHYAAERSVINDALALAARVIPVPAALLTRMATPLVEELPVDVTFVLHALCEGNSVLRRSVADLVPLPLLSDVDPEVRMEALRALRTRLSRAMADSAPAEASPSASLVIPPAAILPYGAALAILHACPVDASDADAALVSTVRTQPTVAAALAMAESAAAVTVNPATGALHATSMPGYASRRQLTADARFVAPMTDSIIAETSLLRVAAPVLAHATLSAIASIRGGADPAAPAHTLPSTLRGMSVAAVSAAVGRLLRGAADTAESDPNGRPDASIVAALQTIAAGAPLDVLQAYALSEAGLRRLEALANLSPAWALVAGALVHGGLIRYTDDAGGSPPSSSANNSTRTAPVLPRSPDGTVPPPSTSHSPSVSVGVPVKSAAARVSTFMSYASSTISGRSRAGYAAVPDVAVEAAVDEDAPALISIADALAALRANTSIEADDPVNHAPTPAAPVHSFASSVDASFLPAGAVAVPMHRGMMSLAPTAAQVAAAPRGHVRATKPVLAAPVSQAVAAAPARTVAAAAAPAPSAPLPDLPLTPATAVVIDDAPRGVSRRAVLS